MKKFIAAFSISMIVLACNNNGKEPSNQGADSSATNSADSIKRAVDSTMKADSSAKHMDTLTMPKKDSIKK
jgi:hypothetical protein